MILGQTPVSLLSQGTQTKTKKNTKKKMRKKKMMRKRSKILK